VTTAYLLAALSSALYVLGYAGFDLWPLALVALVPVLYAVERVATRDGQAIGLGLGFGALTHAAGYSWLLATLQDFSGLPLPACVLVFVLLCLFQGGQLALFVWLLTTLIYDGLILLVTTAFDRYPLEGPLLGLMFLNPVDLGRVLLLLSFDISALMGYTGAVYQRFFQGPAGMLLAFLMLGTCATVPFLLGLHWFRRKDF